MSGERKRISVEAEYATALGLAVYTFACCEWQVVWCCEKIHSGSIKRILSKEMTAGQIGKYFTNIVRNMRSSKKRDELLLLASEFLKLVTERNRIMHGKPCTTLNKQQRLSGGSIIEVNDLEIAADAFAACNVKLNSIFYEFLHS